MKRFEVFRAGRHTAMSGVEMDFTPDMLREAAAAYDPGLSEAPLVVGHPKGNGPAYGWAKSLHFNEETGCVEADPHQVEPAFSDMVQGGRFKKRSASWYMPDHPRNPTPGKLYLRHIGFLGDTPPAIKGLKEVSFSEEDGATVEFSDSRGRWAFGHVAEMMRNVREWMIGKASQEEADRVLPNYLLSAVADAAREPETMPASAPAFAEGDPMTIAELQAQVAKLTAERDAAVANAKPADFSEREATLAAREAAAEKVLAAATRATIEARVDAAIRAGRLLPAQRKQAVDFAMSLQDGEATFDFGEGEGDKAAKVSMRDAYLKQIETGPRVVEYGELSGNDGRDTSNLPSLSEIQAGLLAQVAGAAK